MFKYTRDDKLFLLSRLAYELFRFAVMFTIGYTVFGRRFDFYVVVGGVILALIGFSLYVILRKKLREPWSIFGV